MKAEQAYQRGRDYSHTLDSSRYDPIVTGRAAVLSLGWERYHPNEPKVEVIDLDGKRRWITKPQNDVLQAVRHLQERASVSRIAASLGYATSTVSRALLKLASFGLVAYDVTRGRYGGITMLKLAAVDVKRRAQSAWEKLRDIRVKAELRAYDRLSRSGYVFAFNVASYRDMDATLKPWTAEDMSEVDGMTP